MRLGTRVTRLQTRLGTRNRAPLTIYWNGRHEQMWKERVARGIEAGLKIRVVTIAVSHLVDAMDDIEEVLANFPGSVPPNWGVVLKDRNDPMTTLARRDPVFPDWLQAALDDHGVEA